MHTSSGSLPRLVLIASALALLPYCGSAADDESVPDMDTGSAVGGRANVAGSSRPGVGGAPSAAGGGPNTMGKTAPQGEAGPPQDAGTSEAGSDAAGSGKSPGTPDAGAGPSKVADSGLAADVARSDATLRPSDSSSPPPSDHAAVFDGAIPPGLSLDGGFSLTFDGAFSLTFDDGGSLVWSVTGEDGSDGIEIRFPQ